MPNRARRASVFNNFFAHFPGQSAHCSENAGCAFQTSPPEPIVIEACTRLGLALFLSIGLALLLAWGWDNSDPLPLEANQVVENSSAAPPPAH
jgi:hypothetical protein